MSGAEIDPAQSLLPSLRSRSDYLSLIYRILSIYLTYLYTLRV